MTQDESKVLEILINHPPTTNVWGAPIHAVDKALGWSTADSTKFVNDMLKRHLLQFRSRAKNLLDPSDVQSQWWEKSEKAEGSTGL
jgi:hypothetical protein